VIEVGFASTTEQLEQVRGLLRAFVAWHRQRHIDDLELIDDYFDATAFEEELASLPGKYSPPHGRLLLATRDKQPAGCVALRQLDDQACEMKRMFVPSHLRGAGVGRVLANAVINEARIIGYSVIRLDTSIRQVEAQRLYEGLGFVRIQPYYDLPERMQAWLVFMELRL
jgi:GNAT superfamily N-acetyltransferase